MNLTEYKFIVSSGCSYGLMVDSLHVKNHYQSKIFDDFGESISDYTFGVDNTVFINAAMASQTSEWALHSTQYIINKLLSLGIPSENIYCFVEWTQYNRFSTATENFIDLKKIPKIRFFGYGVHFNNFKITKLLNDINIQMVHDVMGIGVIDNCSYINANAMQLSKIEEVFGLDGRVMVEKQIQHNRNTTNLILLKHYLNNIISLQNYLKSNNIKYNFCNMQSEFDGWVKTGFEYQQKLKYGNRYQKYYIKDNKTIFQNLDYDNVKNDGIHVLDAYPQLSHLYKLIDFSKWWFYKKDGFKFGGIDEYFLHTYDTYAYSNLMHYNHNEINVHDIVGGYNWHPTEILYTLLHNEAAFNNPFISVKQEWSDYLINLLNEDINYKGITKHKLSCSKNYYENIIQHEHTKL